MKAYTVYTVYSVYSTPIHGWCSTTNATYIIQL